MSNVAILSGDIGTGGDSSDNSDHVVVASTGIDSTAVLDGFTVRDGSAVGIGFPADAGGGLFVDHASPTLSNLIVSGNRAKNGAGMYNYTASPILQDVTIVGNASTTGDGEGCTTRQQPGNDQCVDPEQHGSGWRRGMFNTGSSPTLTNATFDSNSARTGGECITRIVTRSSRM